MIGLITIRGWGLIQSESKFLLRSLFVTHSWNSNIILSDKRPEINNDTGLYSYLPDNFPYDDISPDRIYGIVECRGEIQIHGDGTIRSEWAKILTLFIHRSHRYETANDLQVNYSTMVIYTDNIRKSIKKWLSDNKSLVDENGRKMDTFAKKLANPITSVNNSNVRVETHQGPPKVSKRQGWALFFAFLALDIFAFISCIQYLTHNEGIFHSDNPRDLGYHYEATGELSANQFTQLNNYMITKGYGSLPNYSITPAGTVLLASEVVVNGNDEIDNPKDYNLSIIDNTQVDPYSPRGIGICALVGLGCFAIGGAILNILFSWARSNK